MKSLPFVLVGIKYDPRWFPSFVFQFLPPLLGKDDSQFGLVKYSGKVMATKPPLARP